MSSLPVNTGPRIAVRALIVEDDKLLLVNAYPGDESDLWCAPGGGVEKHQSLTENLIREVHEETGLTITVGGLAGVNEFHDPTQGFHQVDLFFRASIVDGALDEAWEDVDQIVNRRRFFTQHELQQTRYKPNNLANFAFSRVEVGYDPLELLVR